MDPLSDVPSLSKPNNVSTTRPSADGDRAVDGAAG